MKTRRDSVSVLDSVIQERIQQNGRLSGYAIVGLIDASEATIRYRLKRMVKDGRLDMQEIHNTKIYSIPRRPGA